MHQLLTDGFHSIFPAYPWSRSPFQIEIIQALGFTPKGVFKTDVNILVEMDDPDEVKQFMPNFLKLAELPFQGLIITARGGDDQV